MDVTKELIDEVARHGGRLVREGELLRVSAPAPLPTDLQARLREHKPDLLAALADGDKSSTDGQSQHEADAADEARLPPDVNFNLLRVAAAHGWMRNERRAFARWAVTDINAADQFLKGELARIGTHPAPGAGLPVHECRYCGSADIRIEAGTVTHAAGMRCGDCGRHAGWVPKAIAATPEFQRMAREHAIKAQEGTK